LASRHSGEDDSVPSRASAHEPVEAVLFDRDGTLVVDVPYNGEPARVRLMPGAAAAMGRLRRAGLAIGLVSNQSGIARGLITRRQVDDVNRKLASLVGGFDVIEICPHAETDGCGCRKPAPGLIRSAARRLGVPVAACVVVGDIGADVDAAQAAGARGILVPTPRTLPAEIAAAPEQADDLLAAVELILTPPGPAGGMPQRFAGQSNRP
jgi:histidinol-phosphate phosphatase family protein